MKLVALSTRRRVTIAMFTLAVVLFGAVSLGRLKVNLLPDLSYPTLTVRTEYEGAAPIEIENLITKPIEEALGAVKNVKEVRSISRTGQSDVVLEFEWGTNMDYAGLDVREKLDALLLPLQSERPILLRFDPSLDPIMRFGLALRSDTDEALRADAEGETPVQSTRLSAADGSLNEDGLKYLRRYADESLKKDLESALGVAAVKISGGLEDEVQVFIDPQKLSQLNLPVERIVQVLNAENVNLSGGRLEEGTQQYLVRTVNQFQSVSEIGNVIVVQRPGTPIYMRDVADIRLGYREREAITRINGTEAVEIAVYKEGDANTVAVAKAVQSRLSQIRRIMPEDIEVVPVYDQSTFISQAVGEVIKNGIIGGILAIIILYLFLRHFGTTVIISLSIPVSIIATFSLMFGFDLTMNIMSLGGLALGIGLLLDNSIVVLENIARHREMGKSALQAATDGASEVGRAVVASTLTTVAVFFPLVFVQGIAGQLFRDQALTVTFSLLASLLVALTLIPMLASFGEKRAQDFKEETDPPTPPKTKVGGWIRIGRVFVFTTIPQYIAWAVVKAAKGIGQGAHWVLRPIVGGFHKGYEAIEKRYPALIDQALHRKGLVLGTSFLLFALTMLLVPTLGVELIPQLSQSEMTLEFRMPPGTPLEQTDASLARVQRAAATLGEVHTTFSVAGSGNRMDANPEEGGENWGELHIAMTPGSAEAEELRVQTALRQDLQRMPGLQYKFGRPTLFTFETPVEIEIAGYDLDRLKQVSEQLAARMDASSRFADVKSSMERGHPEVQIVFDRERAAALGLAVHDLADRVVSKVRGEVATKYSWHDRKIDVLVRAREEDRASIDQIRRLVVNPESDRPVPLEAIADVIIDEGPGEIRRVSQQRVGLITANLNFGDLGAASEEINQFVAQTPIPTGVTIRQAGQQAEMSESFRSLLFALALAIFLVYLVMASQFESLLHPFVIFFSIPLALIGAVLALWLTGSTLSVVVFIGLILLVGIVVNNAIVLVDLINQLRTEGMPKVEAIIEAGRLRLRPILMTTLTTTLGLLPLAIGIGEGAEIRAPMAITVIGGLTISTLLTLLVIPVMYAVLDRRPDVSATPVNPSTPEAA